MSDEWTDREKLIFASYFHLFSVPSHIVWEGKQVLVVDDIIRNRMLDALVHVARNVFKDVRELEPYVRETVEFNNKFSAKSLAMCVDKDLDTVLKRASENGA